MTSLLRAGFALLLLALAGFGALFVAEARAAHDALEATRTLRAARATEALQASLRSELDVAEARIAVSRDLPLMDVEGLLRLDVQGVQWLPRVVAADARREALAAQPCEGAADAGLSASCLGGQRATLEALLLAAQPCEGVGDAGLSASCLAGQGATLEALATQPCEGVGDAGLSASCLARQRATLEALLRATQPCERAGDAGLSASCLARQHATLATLAAQPCEGAGDAGLSASCLARQRATLEALLLAAHPCEGAGDAGLSASCLAGQRATLEALLLATQPCEGAGDAGLSASCLAGQRATLEALATQPCEGPGDAGLSAACSASLRTAREAVLQAWPRLSPLQATYACARLSDDAGFSATCRTALRTTREAIEVGPVMRVSGGWLLERHDDEVHGVAFDVPARLGELHETLTARGTLEAQDALVWLDAAPPRVDVQSPALARAASAVDRALGFKLLLLLFTAGLGVLVLRLERRTARQREDTLRLQREFVSAISHELRTPLASIRLMAETLERRLPGDGPARDYPHRLVAAADRLSLLVENVLSFSRLEAGRVVPAREPFVWASLRTWLEEDAALLEDPPATLQLSGLDALPAVQLDVTLARLLVSNLLRNASSYGRDAHHALRFEVSGRVEGGYVVLRFCDDGGGIPSAEAARAFEPFTRLTSSGTSGGTGLGLAVARQVARLHGGDLQLRPSARGACFEWTVPAWGGG